jgi:hypothetical protein
MNEVEKINLMIIRLSAFFLVAISLGACNKKMIQLSLLKPSDSSIVEGKDKYVFENDTVRITYSFWAHHGQFGFSIQNKLSIPIYVDWKKSNLVYNNGPNVYWTEETVIKTNSITTGIGFRGSYGVAVGSARKTEESVIRPKERITFLPPSSIIERNEYAIDNAAYYFMNPDIKGETVAHDAKPGKTTIVYKQSFTENVSPIKLTNFLTLSTKESFENEWFIENTFYLKEVAEMELKHFRGKCEGEDENQKPICPRVLKSNKKYFLYVPKGFDFAKRKKKKMTKYVDPYSTQY